VKVRGGAALPSYTKTRQFVRVGIRDELQIVGIGEASPLPPYAGDIASALAVTLGDALAELAELDDSLPVRDVVAAAMAPVEARLAALPIARFALETALFDAACVRRGVSVAEGLSGKPGFEQVPYNVLLDASLGGLEAAATKIAMEPSIQAVKVKLRARDDAGFERELLELWALRRVLPAPFELRLDPNGAWGLDEARRKLTRLAALSPRYVEQPVSASLLPDLGPTDTPWAADESLCLPGLAERLAEARGCQAFILKPAAVGGLTRALALAELGAAAGFELVVTHYLDGPVGLAAASELARALPKRPLACGLEPHAGIAAYPPMRLPHHGSPGFITRPALPGLGFSDEERTNQWLAMA